MRFNLIAVLLLLHLHAAGGVWHVGPTRQYTTPAAVSGLAGHGDTIYIDAAEYPNHPQVYFGQDGLLIRGLGGRPRLEAGAALANNSNGKAILVIGGDHVHIDHIEFANAVVPDHNGAGIRQEGCALTVTHCFFNGNEMGILGGNIPACNVRLEHNIFVNNGSSANPGYQHNVYIGRIDTLIFRYNYSINAIAEGHELKSRAAVNIIQYNYIGNLTTVDSRTVDLPNGGTVILVGNVLEQGPSSANSNIFGYGLEGMSNNAPHEVWIAHNTFINKKNTGNFIQLANGTELLFLKNNIMVGPTTSGLIQGNPTTMDSSHNLIHPDIGIAGFQSASDYDYHLLDGSPAIDQGVVLDQVIGDFPLWAENEYADTAGYQVRMTNGLPDIGAFESGMVSLDHHPAPGKLVFYPNPTGTYIRLEGISSNTTYSLFDLGGRYRLGGIVRLGNIDVSLLEPGVYVLCVAGKSVILLRE